MLLVLQLSLKVEAAVNDCNVNRRMKDVYCTFTARFGYYVGRGRHDFLIGDLSGSPPQVPEQPQQQVSRIRSQKSPGARCEPASFCLIVMWVRWQCKLIQETLISGTTFSGKKCPSGTSFHAI
jgi:hypothetical protein